MATLYITEYNEVKFQGGMAVPIALEPEITSQAVTFTTSTQSSAFDGRTKLVRIHTDAACSIMFGTNPTATTGKRRLAANQTEYFAVPAGQSYKVAAVTNT